MRKTGALALQHEHLQHLNSRVFQQAKHGLGRVAEQPQREDEEQQAGDGAPRRRKISTSLPDLSAVYEQQEEGDTKSTVSNATTPPVKIPSSSSDNHLRVSHRMSPAASPTNSSPIPPSGHPHPHHHRASPKRQQNTSQSSRLKLPPVDSPNQSPVSARRRGSVPNRAFSGSRPMTIPASAAPMSRQAGLSRSPPDNWAPSAHHNQHGAQPIIHITVADKTTTQSRTRQTWEGKPSSAIPSYLFR